MSKSRHPNKFGIRGSGSPNVITLARPAPRSMTRSEAAVFAAWLVAFCGDPDYFARVLIEVWGSRYGAAQIPDWLMDVAGPWEPAPDDAASGQAAAPDPRQNAGEARARSQRGSLGDAPRVVPQKSLYVPRASGQDSGPATRAPRPQPLDGAPPMVSPESELPPTPSAVADSGGAPKGRGRLTIGGKPASREDIARVAEEARRNLTGEGMKPAPATVDEMAERAESGGGAAGIDDDAAELLSSLTAEDGGQEG